MSGPHSATVLHWQRPDSYFLTVLDPNVQLVIVEPGEVADDAARKLLAHRPSRVLLHIDISRPGDFVRTLPALVETLSASGVEVWNGSISDIRKSVIQDYCRSLGLPSTLAPREGAEDEPVIVKTNLNSRGIREWSLSAHHRAALGWPSAKPSPLHNAGGYLVMPRREVPNDWWSDDQVFIERYVDNPGGVFFRVYFVGEQAVTCQGSSTQPVRRMSDATQRFDFLLRRDLAHDGALYRMIDDMAADVFTMAVVFAEALGLDFGCIDLVVDEGGVPYVVDVNPTPFWGSDDRDRVMLEHLRSGFDAAPRIVTNRSGDHRRE